MTKKNIEIVGTSEFGKAKRNSLVSSGLLFTVAVAAPVSLAIPGQPSQSEKFPLPVVLLILMAPAALFLYELIYEWVTTRLRNAPAAAGDEPEDRAKTFEHSLNKTYEKLDEMKSSIDDGYSQIAGKLKSYHVSELYEDVPDGDAIKSSLERLRAMVRNLESAFHAEGEMFGDGRLQASINSEAEKVQQEIVRYVLNISQAKQSLLALESNFEEAMSSSGNLKMSIEGYKSTIDRMREDLTKLADNIFKFQETAFFWKDLILHLAVFFSAFFLSLFRIIEAGGVPFGNWKLWVAGGLPIIVILTCGAIYRRINRRSVISDRKADA